MNSGSKLLRYIVEDALLAPRLYLLRLAGKLLVSSYRFKWPQLDWWKDRQFTSYLDRFGELSGLNTDRKWMLHQLLRLVADVPGDTAECGVFRGATSYLICCANKQARAGAKIHHLFDSFEGLSQPEPIDGKHWNEGDLKCDIQSVRAALADFEKLEFHQGWIPERFDDVKDKRFSFVHIDVDLAQPTRDSLAFFYPRMETGGIIVCDDYGISTCAGATRAVDQFLKDKPEKMLALPDGGGFFIAGRSTSEPTALS